jgi:predicted deacylase
MGKLQQRFALLLMLGAATGACVSAPPPPLASAPAVAGADCRSASASLHFDFPGASASACSVTGAREFTLLITPEHAPPINPSPWYGFRYQTDRTADPVTVTLRYLGGGHRYAPKWSDGGETWRELPSTPVDDGKGAAFQLPPGKGLIAAQEIITPADTMAAMQRWSAVSGVKPFTLGQSHDGRPITAIRLGRADAPRLVILLGRQHPPEVTGAMAMQAFVDALVDDAAGKPATSADLQFLIVPMLNPDGTVRGHWRANRGAVDLNRDWGEFTQPETRAVKAWLDALPSAVRPVLMVDFHSTGSNLFYVQGDAEATVEQKRFVAAWLGGQERALAGYPFTLEPRNANPGSGTAKNWFHAVYGIPAITYEVADAADRDATRSAAKTLAHRLLTVLGTAP